MSTWPQVEACLALGDAYGALLAASGLRDGERLPRLRLRRLRQSLGPALERWPQLPGCLAGAVPAWARELDLPVLAALFAPPRPEIGAALFPLALAERGVVRLFRVSSDPVAPGRPVDPAFIEAVELARRAVEQALGLPLADLCSWSVQPPLPGNAQIEGGSVGLAAVVAYASFALRRAPDAADVYTGCLREEGRAVRIAPVCAATLAQKAAAAARLQPGAFGLRFFHPAGNAEPDTHNLLARPVKQSLRDWLSSPELFGPLPPLQQPAPARLSESGRELLFLLLAAGAPVEVGELGRVLPRGLGEALSELEALGLACEREGAWQAAPSPLAERDPPAMAGAHKAWGACRSDLLAGCVHLLKAGEAQAAAERLAAGEGAAVLAQLHDQPLAPDDLQRLVDALPEGATGALLRLIHASLGLPPWLARLGRRLAAHQTWSDRLFTIQALIEACLHLLAACALAEGLVDAITRQELERRPSVGLLVKAVAGIAGAPPGASPAVRGLAEQLEARESLEPLATQLNLALHQKLALGRLALGDEEGARSSVLALAPASLALFGSITRAVAQGFDVREGSADSVGLVALVDGGEDRPLPLSPWLRRLPSGGTVFHRGRLGSAQRWWSFQSPFVCWEPGPPETPLPDPGRLAVDGLPTPLAVAWVHLQRARSAPQRLAAADLLLFVLLRLCAGPTLARELEQSQGRLPKPLDHRLLRMNHRNLLDLALAEAQGTLGGWLRGEEVRAQVEALMDRVERHQHAPGPMADWEDRGVEQAARALLASGPWERVRLRLEGEALCGIAPTVRPRAEWRALELGEEGEACGLGPLCGIPAGEARVYLLVQIERRAKVFGAAEPCWRRLSPDRLWEAPVFVGEGS